MDKVCLLGKSITFNGAWDNFPGFAFQTDLDAGLIVEKLRLPCHGIIHLGI